MSTTFDVLKATRHERPFPFQEVRHKGRLGLCLSTHADDAYVSFHGCETVKKLPWRELELLPGIWNKINAIHSQVRGGIATGPRIAKRNPVDLKLKTQATERQESESDETSEDAKRAK